MNLKASDIYGEWYFKVEKVVVAGECVLRGVCVGGGQGPTCWKSIIFNLTTNLIR